MHRETTSPPGKQELENYEEIVVSTQSYSSSEWVEMNIWSSIIQGFHKYGLLRIVAGFSGDIESFYQSFLPIFSDKYKDLVNRLRGHFSEYLKGEQVNRIRLRDDFWLSPDRWFFYKLLLNYLNFYDFVEGTFPEYREAIDFQRAFIMPINEEKEIEYNGASFHYKFNGHFQGTFNSVTLEDHYKKHMKRLYSPKGPRSFYQI